MRTLLEHTAREAGSLLMRHFRRSNRIRFKAHREIVNAADLAADRLITRRLRAATPRIPILSEEQRPPGKNGHQLWVVDPLDGTTNFSHGNPIWGLNIALLEDGIVRRGVSYLPTVGDLFFAEQGRGAWLNGRRIRVSPSRPLSESTVIFCHGYSPAELRRGARLYAALHPKIRYCRMFGSAAFEMGMVASGAAEAFIYTGPKPWDIAPGVLLIEEAGGTVTDERGRAWSAGQRTHVLVASNGRHHETLLRLVRRAL